MPRSNAITLDINRCVPVHLPLIPRTSWASQLLHYCFQLFFLSQLILLLLQTFLVVRVYPHRLLSIMRRPYNFVNLSEVFGKVDTINRKYGRYTVHLASSHAVITKGVTHGNRTHKTLRSKKKLPGETKYKRLNIPYLGSVS